MPWTNLLLPSHCRPAPDGRKETLHAPDHVIGLIALLLGGTIPTVARSATPAAGSPVAAASDDFAGLIDIVG